ncbi:GM18956 [Drosophila sechellia]|uniref:GM18956 n=1 Tax=Drosophila sechellia TaxID=7238 RepID=B4I9H9_DROSE|nr:GM18956 [Drosophila sechellia]
MALLRLFLAQPNRIREAEEQQQEQQGYQGQQHHHWRKDKLLSLAPSASVASYDTEQARMENGGGGGSSIRELKEYAGRAKDTMEQMLPQKPVAQE